MKTQAQSINPRCHAAALSAGLTRPPSAVPWSRFFSSSRVAQYAGYRTTKAICDHCGEETTCHTLFVGAVRCVDHPALPCGSAVGQAHLAAECEDN